jgi:signal transduction histidine kinase
LGAPHLKPQTESPVQPLELGYPARAERWIASGRAVLATLPPILWWVRGDEFSDHSLMVHVLVWGYVSYAWLLAALISDTPVTRRSLQLLMHAVDLVIYGVLTYLFGAQSSPFAFYFTFAIVAAAIRWEWRGALSTAAIALTLYGSISLYFLFRPDAGFDTSQWTFRMVYLAVMAVLVGYLAAYEARWRREVSGLANWSRERVESPDEGLEAGVAEVAAILRVRRLVVVWEEDEHPDVEVIHWSDGVSQRTRESPETLNGLVPAPLDDGFFCLDAGAARLVSWYAASDGAGRTEGISLRADFRERFHMRQVLAMPLRAPGVSGYLFALDRVRMTADDLILGRIVGRQLAGQIKLMVLTRRLRRAAVNEERLRLAGDLHDGLLQSLSAAALHIQAAQQKLQHGVAGTAEDLDRVQGLIRGEQHDLRFLIEALRPRTSGRRSFDGSLATRLATFAATVQQVWRVGVRLDTRSLNGGLPIAGEHEVYRLVQEAVINAARHAGGTEVRVHLHRADGHVSIVVADDGRGFPFRGRLDHTALAAQNVGPVSLRQRVGRLGGAMTITSAPAGATVEIQLPVSALEA